MNPEPLTSSDLYRMVLALEDRNTKLQEEIARLRSLLGGQG